MSVQIHCDHCDKSLVTHLPYADRTDGTFDSESKVYRLFKTGGHFNQEQSGWAFCDNNCAGLYFLKGCKSDSTQG